MTKAKGKPIRRVDPEAPEVTVFLSCLEAVSELKCLALDYERGDITKVQFSRKSTCIVAEMSELADATERFGIVCPVLEFGKFSPFFWRWFNWWNDLLKSEGNALEHPPKGDWLRYRDTPGFIVNLL